MYVRKEDEKNERETRKKGWDRGKGGKWEIQEKRVWEDMRGIEREGVREKKDEYLSRGKDYTTRD